MPSILIVEDDCRLAGLMQHYLTQHEFTVQLVARGDQALAAFRQHSPDVVLLDLMLPGLNGHQVCQAIRAISSAPILMLTACEDDVDQIIGLEHGADDYVVKPVEPRVLLARLRALLRRPASPPQADTHLAVGQLSLDRAQRQAWLGQQALPLTSMEFEMLWILAQHAGQILDRDRLLNAMRGIEFDGLDRSVDVCISKIRKKLGDNPRQPQRLKTIWGQGYLLTPGEPEANAV